MDYEPYVVGAGLRDLSHRTRSLHGGGFVGWAPPTNLLALQQLRWAVPTLRDPEKCTEQGLTLT